jgi:Ser/Thr protein kinase RdoA (MazF antagonist)
MNNKASFELESETEYFFKLSPAHILDAVEELGFRCTGRCLPLNSLENRVYEVEIEVDDPEKLASPSDRFRIVKFYRPGRWSEEQILEEHTFLKNLKDADIPVVPPVPLADGRTLTRLADVGLWYTVFPKQRGRAPDEMNFEQAERLGRLMARVHNIGAAGKAEHRLRLTPDVYGLQNLHFLLEQNALPIEVRPYYKQVVEEICAITSPWFAEAEAQRIHGDCHIGNILWGPEGPFLVDFDDMLIGPCVQDLWLILPARDEESRLLFQILVDSYEEMRRFDRNTLKLVEPLRALRFIRFSAWIAKRWEDPAFPPIFTRFGTPQYWQEQLADLRHQLETIRAIRV